MEILASRVLLHPKDFERSVAFYEETLGLHRYREFPGGVVFFLGGGFLEVSRQSDAGPTAALELWLQVRDVRAVERHLKAAGVVVLEAPEKKPWGLLEMRIADPDGHVLVIVEIPDGHPLRRRD